MRRVSLFLPDDLLEGLDRLKTEHGTPHAESIRRAIAAYLVEKDVSATAQKGGKKIKTNK
jgi:metal-responsive CopG/Arc/MetJ family transcriptional regulator